MSHLPLWGGSHICTVLESETRALTGTETRFCTEVTVPVFHYVTVRTWRQRHRNFTSSEMGCMVTNVTIHIWRQEKLTKKTHRCPQVRTNLQYYSFHSYRAGPCTRQAIVNDWCKRMNGTFLYLQLTRYSLNAFFLSDKYQQRKARGKQKS